MAKNTVKLKCYEDITLNYEAGGTVSPGMLVELDSSDQFNAHSSAGTRPTPITIALENELEGKGIDHDYEADEIGILWTPRSGDEAYMWLAGNNNAAKYTALESAGDGRLQVASADSASVSDAIVAIALEAVDASDSASDHQRIKVRIS